jgi:hypothetical protein
VIGAPPRKPWPGGRGLAWLALLAAVWACPTSVRAQHVNGPISEIDGPPPPTPPAVVARDASGRITLRATRLPEKLVIDGRLDEAVYSSVEAIGDFVQQEPHEGQPATERTEAWVFFDDRNVYVAARCWESDPSRRVANEMRRDNMNLFQNDHFGVIFDTFYDRRNGFLFYVNALGGFFDGYVTDERDTNRDWNTVWDSRVANFDGGWSVEMAIPFRSLRFQPGTDQIWGINFRRAVRSKNEMDYLTRIPAAYSRNGIARLSQAATLVGVEAGSTGANLELKPYVTAGIRTDRELGLANDFAHDIGFDTKYGVTRGLTFDFTYHTDFAQVEDDEQRVNLTQFSLFFPEKRDFFLEGQGIFAFGGAGGRQRGGDGVSNTPVVFFSRRIGLQNDLTVPVNAGARLTGKVGRYSIGLLDIGTDAEPAAAALATNFSVVRIKRDILRRSTIGVIATRRAPIEEGPGENYAWGVDAGFAFYQNLTINTFYAQTRTTDRSGDDLSYRAQVDYSGDRYGLEVERLAVGANFNPEIGYVRRDDIRRNFVKARFSPRPASIRAIRKLTWEASFDYSTDGAGLLVTQEAQGRFQIDFESGDEWNVDVLDGYELLKESFDPIDGITIPVGEYRAVATTTSYRLGPQRRISGWIEAGHAGYYEGHRTEFGYRGRIEVSPRFALEPGLSWNWVAVPQGAFTSNLFSTRATINLSPRMFVGALVQYITADDTISANLRFRWEYKPGCDLFLVYNEGRNTALRGFPTIDTRTFIVKIAHGLRF